MSPLIGILTLIGLVAVVYYVYMNYVKTKKSPKTAASVTGQSNIGQGGATAIPTKPGYNLNSITGTGGAINPSNSGAGDSAYSSAIPYATGVAIATNQLADFTDPATDSYTSITGNQVND